MYPGYTRYIELTEYIFGKQRCVPGVVISICIQGTRDNIELHGILFVNSDVYLGSSSQCVSRVQEIYYTVYSW